MSLWFQPQESDPEAPIRLFLFPYAGAGAPMYRDWHTLFPDDVAVQALQLPGRLDRRAEPLHTDLNSLLDALCEAFAAELDGRPYGLFGHSMGALLAYRVGLTLEKELGAGPALLASAGWAPLGFAMPTEEQINLPQTELVDWIVGLGSVPEELYRDPDLLALTLPATRADLSASLGYVDDGAMVSCPVVSYSGRSDPLISKAGMTSWAERSPRYLGNSEFPGGHFFVYAEALAIASDLTRHLRRSASSTF
jgi:surfactin synthase thioesterase subunit